jgi:hypothetical protein
MTSLRVLAASRRRSQAATRLLIAVRRAERTQRTPGAGAASRVDGAFATDTRDARPRQTLRDAAGADARHPASTP